MGFECFELSEFIEFYRWFYNRVDYILFCKIIEKPPDDSWAAEKWSKTRNFAIFALEYTDLAKLIWNYWQKTKVSKR